MSGLAFIASHALQWAEDDDRALTAARAAWDRMDSLLVGALVILTAAVALVSGVMLLRERASRRRRFGALGILLGGCTAFVVVTAKMGVVWLVADPVEAGGPVLGSGAYWIWCLWLFGAALLGIASVIGAFIVVGAEEL
ncbi:MAG: hypothetical protein ABI333_24275 [bacterium]